MVVQGPPSVDPPGPYGPQGSELMLQKSGKILTERVVAVCYCCDHSVVAVDVVVVAVVMFGE